MQLIGRTGNQPTLKVGVPLSAGESGRARKLDAMRDFI